MDIVIEGKIDSPESMSEVLETMLHLNSVHNAVLRLSSTDNTVTGRVAFSQNGYILGGRVDVSGETGYPAIRKLLSIKTGNYAVLDVGRTHIPEVNQTLWINAEQLLPVLSNLPESSEGFVEGNREILDKEKIKTGHINLRTKEWKDEPGPPTVDAESKVRKFDVVSWRYTIVFLWCIILLSAAAATVQYWDDITRYIPLPMLHRRAASPPSSGNSPTAPSVRSATPTAPAAPK